MNEQWPHQAPGYLPPATTGPGRPVPVDVQTAFQLWWGVAGLGVVYLFGALAMVYADRDAYTDQLLKDFAAQNVEVALTRSTAEQLLLVGLGITALLGFAVTALFLLFVYRMRRGRNWARMVLTMIGIFLLFSAIPTIFGFGAAGGGAAVVVGVAGIVQAVLAVGAIVLMHRRESNRYFLRLPPA